VDVRKRLKEKKEAVDRRLEHFLSPGDSILHRAMRYAVLSGGKRYRPLLLLSAGECFPVPMSTLLPFACALELVHNYSLVHDDLPAMDDDDFRRGKPSCHKAYGESVAILAGDALLTLAFEVMARGAVEEPHLSRKIRCIEEVGRMAGAEGMVGGQVLDINYDKGKATEDYYDKLILMKTAGLIAASVRVGAIMGGADPVQLESLSEYGRNIGLAFQTRDDILDSKEDSPLRHGDRPNSVVFFGFEEAERRLHSFVEKGIGALESISMATPELRCLAEMLLVYHSGKSP